MKHIKRTKHGLVEKKTGRTIVSPLEPMVSKEGEQRVRWKWYKGYWIEVQDTPPGWKEMITSMFGPGRKVRMLTEAKWRELRRTGRLDKSKRWRKVPPPPSFLDQPV